MREINLCIESSHNKLPVWIEYAECLRLQMSAIATISNSKHHTQTHKHKEHREIERCKKPHQTATPIQTNRKA